MKFLDYMKSLLSRTAKTKGLSNEAKEQITTLLLKSIKTTKDGTAKIDDQIAELKKLEQTIANSERTTGEITAATKAGDRPQGESATMYKGPERSLQFVAERTGLSPDRAKAAILEKMNEGYPPGSLKRTAVTDDDMIKAYLDNNLGYASEDVLEFLEDIQDIGQTIKTDNVIDIKSAPKKKEGLASLTNPNDADIEKFITEQGEKAFPNMNEELKAAAASKENAKRIIASESPPDEFFGTSKVEDMTPAYGKPVNDMTPEEVEALKIDQFVDDTVETRTNIEGLDEMQLTDLAGDMAKQVFENKKRIARLIEVGEFEKARELENLNQKALSKMSGKGEGELEDILDVFPFDPDKPKMATGGRVGLADGSGKLPMTRRGFLGVLGGGIATLMGGKALLPAAKTGIAASKAASAVAAPGMPSWFPLLVDKMMKQGTKVKEAVPGKGDVETVYKLKGSSYHGIDDLIMYENTSDGTISIAGRGSEGQEVGFTYTPEKGVLMEDGKQIKQPADFEAGEFFKGETHDVENIGGMDDIKGDITNIVDFAEQGSTKSATDVLNKFLKDTRTEDIGFKQGGLVPPQAGPMASGMGSLFRQRTA